MTAARASLLLLALAGCAAPAVVDGAFDVLAGGGFVPSRVDADLTFERAVGAAVDAPLAAAPQAGWARPGPRGWRPIGAEATLRLRTPATAGAWELALGFRRRRGGLATGVQRTVEVLLDERQLGLAELGSGRTTVRLPATPGKAATAVSLRFALPLERSAEGIPELDLEHIGYLRPGTEPSTGAWHRARVDADTRAVVLPEAGAWVVPMVIPRDADALRLTVRAAVPVRFSLRPVAGADAGRPVVRLDAAPGSGGDPAARDVHLPLADLAGQRVVFQAETIGADPDEAGRWSLAEPAVLRRRRVEPGKARRPPAPGTDRAPDVVLLILDALRADRLGAYGYTRDTSPAIDRLAERAVVFAQAYAGCPSTSCSIPNLLTGRPVAADGPAAPGRLDGAAVTLAEALAARGYRTVGFSANPYNSASRNLHQGFEVFRGLWGPGHGDHGPLAMARLADDQIRATAADRPLYLQLHLLPPHEPYEPPPEHDLWRDADYRGPVEPGMNLRPYRRGGHGLDAADRAQLMALYDGNVRYADAAVGRVLDALERAGRLAGALIVVTSDHGEAFFEHGEQGHNSTLYDEMLHVPLIVRLPAGHRPPGIDAASPVRLSDVVPTVLGALGIEAPAGIEGVDLLDPSLPGRAQLPVRARTTHPLATIWSLRRGRFKAILRPSHGVRQLFDKQLDPGERVDRAADDPAMMMALALELRAMQAAARGRPAPEPAALTDDERAALRALGYLE